MARDFVTELPSKAEAPADLRPSGGYPSRTRAHLPPLGRDAEDPTGWSKISAAARKASGLDQEALADIYNDWINFLGEEQQNPHQFKAFLAGVALVRDAEPPAQAIEARRAEPLRVSVHESAVVEDNAPASDLLSFLKTAETDLSAALARVERLENELAGWKRVAVVAALPLEAMRMAGTYRALSHSTQACVDEAVVTIRMAVGGYSLPPEGDMDAAVAPARAALSHSVPEEA